MIIKEKQKKLALTLGKIDKHYILHGKIYYLLIRVE